MTIWNDVSSSDNEATIRNKISSWLSACGIDYSLEHPTAVGPVDLHLLHRHCIIEVKTAKKLKSGPWTPGTGSRRKESAYEQLSRYLNTVHSQTSLFNDSLLSWRGVVTDGHYWWVWDWPEGERTKSPKIYGSWKGRKLTAGNAVDLEVVLKRDAVGKPWPPSEPAKLKALFANPLIKFNSAYKFNKNMANTKIQKHLWLEQLKASGHHPEPGDEDDLFVKHTLLILTSRLISGLSVPRLDGGPNTPLLEGFVGWASNAHEDLVKLSQLINAYNWSGNQTDVMRSLYMTLIPKKQRKLYGEYYTPDWLAEKICAEVIDEKYVREQVKNFMAGDATNGILDPACGSGTFLYSAAKHLLKSKAVIQSGMGKEMQADFVCNMIHGIDILPVAVEMAVANIARVLGGIEPSRLRIHQGDSLLASRTTSTVHGTMGDAMTMYANTTPLRFPYGFLERADAIYLFVTSARRKQKMPAILEKHLDKRSRDLLRAAHVDLSKVIERFGNGVWAWYIKNQAAPLLLSNGPSVARIVTNPPWLRKSHIRDKRRQESIEMLAKDLNVYQGGKMATSLDLASVFVARCDSLYIDPAGKAGWVLPDTAICGTGQWEQLRTKFGDRLGEMWHLGTLPFPKHGSASVIFIGAGKKGKIQKATLCGRQKPRQYDSWDGTVSDMISLKDDETRNSRTARDFRISFVNKTVANEFRKIGTAFRNKSALLLEPQPGRAR